MTNPRKIFGMPPKHIGVAADHGGFALKEKLGGLLRGSGYVVVT